jgi:hypothetical protein
MIICSQNRQISSIYYNKSYDCFRTSNCYPLILFAGVLVDRYFWLGATDRAVEGTFVWNSGAPWGYTNWIPTNPDNFYNEDCLHAYWRPSRIGWNDWSCNNIGAYLCEKEPSG